MVKGLDVFQNHFRDYINRHILIYKTILSFHKTRRWNVSIYAGTPPHERRLNVSVGKKA
jgi:hypothetical protein